LADEMNKMHAISLTHVFSALEKEHRAYLSAVANHPESSIDEFVIMDECYRELPKMVPDKLVESVMNHYHKPLAHNRH
jgi:hypothetical protein